MMKETKKLWRRLSKGNFEAYGHGQEQGHHVFIKAYFEETEDHLCCKTTEVLLISPKPQKETEERIFDLLVKQGPWLQDYVWSDVRVMA